jgi:hypothetical protein
MKDVESVTGNLGGSEPVTPAEEVGAISVADQAESEQHAKSDGDVDPSAMALPSNGGSQPSRDPWQALLQVGAQFAGALAAVGSPGTAAHPWIERDPATGGQSLKIPLPPPQIAKQLADVLIALAESVRGRTG